MLKAFFTMLLVLAAFSGGIYALNGSKKGSRRPKSDDGSSTLRRYEPYFSTPRVEAPVDGAKSPTVSSHLVSSHVVAVIVAALLLGLAAYLGLGQALQANAVPTATVSATMDRDSLHDDLRPEVWHSQDELSQLVVNAQLAPPPAAVTDAAPLLVTAPAAADPPPPAPAPTEAPVVEAYVPEPGSIEAIICALPWPCEEAIGVARCESGTDRNGHLDGNWATNGNHFGLFQISGIHAWRWADFWDAWSDPARNAQYAFDIWSESGWRPWSCRPY